jgi:hypothetical protein
MPMSLCRRLLVLALLVVAGCESHAQSLARGATVGVKSQVAQIDPAVVRSLGEQAGRGAVTGAMAELVSPEQRAMFEALVDSSSDAAARAVMKVLGPEETKLTAIFAAGGATAVGGIGRALENDPTVRDAVAAIAHQTSVSAVYGVRDSLADLFPECKGGADWRRCVETAVSDISNRAARGMVAGFVSAAKMPIIAFVFLAGVLVTLLLQRTWAAFSHHGRTPEPKHAP